MLQHPHSQTDIAALLHTFGQTQSDSTDEHRHHSTAILHTCGQTNTAVLPHVSGGSMRSCMCQVVNSVKCDSQENLEYVGI